MKLSFADKKILVTGGTRGIGEAIALSFEKAHGSVWITGTKESSFNLFKERNPESKVNFICADFSDDSSLEDVIRKTSDLGFDVLVNNAGINKIDKLRDISIEDFDNVQKVNLRAPFTLIKTLSTSMAHKKWGRIVNISSIFGLVTKEKRTSYSVSKNAINGLTKSAALDLAGEGILVNSVSPGFIDTELTRNVLGEEGIREMVKLVPLGRLGSPESISSAVLFLCSEENQFLTGQNIVVDGGFTCG